MTIETKFNAGDNLWVIAFTDGKWQPDSRTLVKSVTTNSSVGADGEITTIVTYLLEHGTISETPEDHPTMFRTASEAYDACDRYNEEGYRRGDIKWREHTWKLPANLGFSGVAGYDPSPTYDEPTPDNDTPAFEYIPVPVQPPANPTADENFERILDEVTQEVSPLMGLNAQQLIEYLTVQKDDAIVRAEYQEAARLRDLIESLKQKQRETAQLDTNADDDDEFNFDVDYDANEWQEFEEPERNEDDEIG